MNNQMVHNLLLKNAREATYTALEVEEINFLTEEVLIKYFLNRETNRILSNTTLEEKVIETVYNGNKDNYKVEPRYKIDSIFIKDKEKATKILKELTIENFDKLKKENDEKEISEKQDEYFTISNIQPEIQKILLQNPEIGILKDIIEVSGGFHLLYLKGIQEERQATYEEAKELIVQEILADARQQITNQIINTILDGTYTFAAEGEKKEDTSSEKSEENNSTENSSKKKAVKKDKKVSKK